MFYAGSTDLATKSVCTDQLMRVDRSAYRSTIAIARCSLPSQSFVIPF